jgi:hypothetical protein
LHQDSWYPTLAGKNTVKDGAPADLLETLSCAEPGAAREELNDQEHKKLSNNGSAEINADVDWGTRPAREKTLMVLIQAGD